MSTRALEDIVDVDAAEAFQSSGFRFQTYLNRILHDWLRVLTTLAFILVPMFFILDTFIVPREVLTRVGLYRLASTLVLIAQYVIVRRGKPGKASYVHAYLVSINVGGIIAIMTVLLGGFNSPYYAGLNLVIMGVNLLLPWRALHSLANSLIVVGMYVVFNVIAGQPFAPELLANNLFFLLATATIAISINHVKYNQVKKEFSLMVQLSEARDALWSEMELAKRIQTALLPEGKHIRGYEVASVTIPTKEVGGDYYDIIQTNGGNQWVSMGDVSGHGVDSGLVMMMAQTSIFSIVNDKNDASPSEILSSANKAIRENIERLGSDHYMTVTLLRLDDSQITVAGRHQDLILYRYAGNRTEVLPTRGTWLGIAEDITDFLVDSTVGISKGDLIVLFTDGITEATDSNGEMFGQERLERLLNQFADLSITKLAQRIIAEVEAFQDEQADDITLVILRKT